MEINKKKKLLSVIMIIMITIISLFVLSMADGAEPGSEGDPIVTLSFVDKKIEQIKYYVDSTIGVNQIDIEKLDAELKKKDREIEELKRKVESSLTFEVVELERGQSLIADEGAEIIIRSGKTSAVYGQQGGLSDITSAKDLQKGESIELNHMLIASRGDGRGVKAESKVYLIIKGGYELK